MNKNIIIMSIILLLSACMASAVNMLTYSDGKNIYINTNGISFSLAHNATNDIGLENITSICISNDGHYIYAMSTRISSSHLIKSADYGLTWNTSTIDFTAYITCDYSGQYVYLAHENNTNPATIGKSTDYGNTFTTISLNSIGFSNPLNSISTSINGNIVAAVGSVGGGSIYYSNNYGATWTSYNALGSGSYNGICTSYDGSRIFASKASGQMYVNNKTYGNLSNWYVFGNALSSATPLKFACYGDELVAYNENKTFTNDGSQTVTTHNLSYISNYGNNNLTLLYAINGTNILYSTNKGVTWTTQYTATSAINAFAMTSNEYVNNTVQGCIDNSTYCTNIGTNYYGIHFCNSVAESSFCSGGCYNDICSTNGTAECAIVGERKCFTSTQYGTCDDSNSDGFLDYNTRTNCNAGTSCVDAFHYADCRNNTQSGTHNLYALSVMPYASNSKDTSYIIDEASHMVKINTRLSSINQDFYTTGTSYINRACDYSETQSYSMITPMNTEQPENNENAGNDTIYLTFGSGLNTDSIMRLSFIPLEQVQNNITVTSLSGSIMTQFSIIRNFTAKQVCIYYEPEHVIMYCDYGYGASDDLQSIDATIIYDEGSHTSTMTFLFNRAADNVRTTYPIALSNSDIYAINFTGKNLTLNNLTINSVSPFGIFESVGSGLVISEEINASCTCPSYTVTCAEVRLVYGYQAYVRDCLINVTHENFVAPCTFNSVGSYRVRTYGNNNGMPDYASYTDFIVNPQNFGLSNSGLDTATGQASHNNEMTQNSKTMWSIAICAILLILGIAIGIITGKENPHAMSIGAMLGLVLMILGLVFFTVLQWLPFIIFLILLIIDGGIIAILAKKIFMTAN